MTNEFARANFRSAQTPNVAREDRDGPESRYKHQH